MKRRFLLIGLGLVIASPTRAQRDYPRAEIFGGYSYLAEPGASENAVTGNLTMSTWWNASVTGNLHRKWGLEADFGGYRGHYSGWDHRTSLFLVGPKIVLPHQRLYPYMHVLLGATRVSRQGEFFHEVTPPTPVHDSATGSALALGGGLDLRLYRYIALRLIQADYLNPSVRVVKNFDQYTGGNYIDILKRSSSNFRLSSGVVLRLP